MTMRASPFVIVGGLLVGWAALAGSAGCGKRPLRLEDRLAKAMDQAPGPGRAKDLLAVARRQAAADDRVGAHDTITVAYNDVSAGGEESVATLLEIAQAYIDVDERRTARTVLNRVAEIAKAIDDPGRKAKTFADAGALFGNADTGMADPQQARALLGEATTLADDVEERFRAEALAVVAMGYVSGGMAEEAGTMVEKLEACLVALSDPRAKAEALAAASSVYAKTGNEEKAKALLADAASTAKGVDRAESKAYALLAVANATAANGDTAAARTLLDEADAAAGQVGDPDAQATAMKLIRTAMSRLK
jgi:ATP/maltotriose-dependent transcriptional regulator MalT